LRRQWLGAGDGHRWNGALYRDRDVQQGGGHLHLHRDRRPWLQRDDGEGDRQPAGGGTGGEGGGGGGAAFARLWLGAGGGHRWNGALYRDRDVQQGGGHLHLHGDRRQRLHGDGECDGGRGGGHHTTGAEPSGPGEPVARVPQ